MFKFYKNILPYVEQELGLAKSARLVNNPQLEFQHLENAHVLGQESTYLHTKTHCLMLMWGLRQLDAKEVLGQLVRIIGAFTKTAISLVPTGNTGGTNISPFKKLPLTKEHAQLIALAKKS